jgi:hypothetical protein
MRAQHKNTRRIKHKMRCSAFCVRGDDGRTFFAVAGGDDLIKQIRRLLIEREIS